MILTELVHIAKGSYEGTVDRCHILQRERQGLLLARNQYVYYNLVVLSPQILTLYQLLPYTCAPLLQSIITLEEHIIPWLNRAVGCQLKITLCGSEYTSLRLFYSMMPIRLFARAFAEHGAQWEKISIIVGRASGDCRDRYRNHLENQDKRNNGPWTKEEEEELTKIVLEMTVEQGKDIDNDVFWGIVSQRMGNRRGRQQVRIKWCVIMPVSRFVPH